MSMDVMYEYWRGSVLLFTGSDKGDLEPVESCKLFLLLLKMYLLDGWIYLLNEIIPLMWWTCLYISEWKLIVIFLGDLK